MSENKENKAELKYTALFKVDIDNRTFGLDEDETMLPREVLEFLINEESLFGLFDADDFKLVGFKERSGAKEKFWQKKGEEI